MRRLECGCELSPTEALVSLCTMHGEYMRAASAIAVRECGRAKPKDPTEFERDLLKVIAPVVIARWSTVTDSNSSSDAIFQHLRDIMRRLG